MLSTDITPALSPEVWCSNSGSSHPDSM